MTETQSADLAKLPHRNCDRSDLLLQRAAPCPEKVSHVRTNKPGVRNMRDTADTMREACVGDCWRCTACRAGSASRVAPPGGGTLFQNPGGSVSGLPRPPVEGLRPAAARPLLRTLLKALCEAHSCSSEVPTRPRALASSGVRPLFRVLRRDFLLARDRFLSRGTTR